MLQRLLIVLGQEKVGNTSGNVLNENCQIICPLYWTKEITTLI